MTDRIHLFSNSSEHSSWVHKNCSNCSKYRPEASQDEDFVCDIDLAILEAACLDSCIDRDIALRMGMDEAESFGWQWKQQCPEFEQVYGWYSIAVQDGKKALLIGPSESEAKAVESVAIARKLFRRMIAEGKKLEIDPDTVEIVVEQLPTNTLGELSFLFYGQY